MADLNADDPIQKQGTSKWLWVGVIVVLAIAAVIIFLNADGDEPELADNAVTTQEERLDTDLNAESELVGDRESALEDNSSTAAEGDTATAPADMIEEPAPDQ